MTQPRIETKRVFCGWHARVVWPNHSFLLPTCHLFRWSARRAARRSLEWKGWS